MINNNEVPKPSDPKSISSQFDTLVEVIRILRRKCPWDSKQTNESIAHLFVEETYEAINAIYEHNDEEFCKELGDIMLHVIMHAIMAEERNAFNLIDVMTKIRKKLIHRHPHVFADVEVNGEEEVVSNWEALKMQEGQRSILDGVPKSLPSLLRAQRIQHKVSRVGFDWENSDGAWDKVFEELNELRKEIENKNKDKAIEELGDLLFAIVNTARFEDIVAEEALHLTNNKFTKRFEYIEKKVKEMGKKLSDMSLEEMDRIWDEAKLNEAKDTK
jgi:XTP/dITP diphosphohydrolase